MNKLNLLVVICLLVMPIFAAQICLAAPGGFSNFDNGNGLYKGIINSKQTFEVEYKWDTRQWFHVKFENMTIGVTYNFSIKNWTNPAGTSADKITTPDNKTVLVWSCDGNSWLRVNKSNYIRGFTSYNFSIRPHACTKVDIALWYPYNYSNYIALINFLNNSQYAQVKQLGYTNQSRPIYAVNITDTRYNTSQKVGIFIVSRQHQSEVIPSWFMDYMLRYLVRTDIDFINQFRTKYIIITIPMVAIDGVYNGASEVNNEAGHDPNRCWLNTNTSSCDIVVYQAKKILNSSIYGGIVNMSIDLHAQGNNNSFGHVNGLGLLNTISPMNYTQHQMTELMSDNMPYVYSPKYDNSLMQSNYSTLHGVINSYPTSYKKSIISLNSEFPQNNQSLSLSRINESAIALIKTINMKYGKVPYYGNKTFAMSGNCNSTCTIQGDRIYVRITEGVISKLRSYPDMSFNWIKRSLETTAIAYSAGSMINTTVGTNSYLSVLKTNTLCNTTNTYPYTLVCKNANVTEKIEIYNTYIKINQTNLLKKWSSWHYFRVEGYTDNYNRKHNYTERHIWNTTYQYPYGTLTATNTYATNGLHALSLENYVNATLYLKWDTSFGRTTAYSRNSPGEYYTAPAQPGGTNVPVNQPFYQIIKIMGRNSSANYNKSVQTYLTKFGSDYTFGDKEVTTTTWIPMPTTTTTTTYLLNGSAHDVCVSGFKSYSSIATYIPMIAIAIVIVLIIMMMVGLSNGNVSDDAAKGYVWAIVGVIVAFAIIALIFVFIAGIGATITPYCV